MSAYFRHEQDMADGYDFLGGTFLPSLRASESPIAMACFRLVTFLPLRPDLRVPFFISFISLSTFLPAEGEYFRVEDFFALVDFFLAVFLVAIFILLGNQMAFSLRPVASTSIGSRPAKYSDANGSGREGSLRP
jgi:hypothetical protein